LLKLGRYAVEHLLTRARCRMKANVLQLSSFMHLLAKHCILKALVSGQEVTKS